MACRRSGVQVPFGPPIKICISAGLFCLLECIYMPKAKIKTKKVAKKSKPKQKSTAKPRARKRLAIPEKVIRQAATKKKTRTFTERIGIGAVSLMLLFSGSLTNAAVVTGTGYDMRRSEEFARSTLAVEVQPKEYLYAKAVQHNLDFELLSRIVACESGWRMVRNSGSSAYGYFQIIDATEKGTPQYKEGARKFDPYTNIDMAVYLFSRYGSTPWNESKHCWAR